MGPYKCPDCGTWWAGFEHRCTTNSAGTVPVRCICSFDAMGHRIPQTALCPLHDTLITYTTGPAIRYGTFSGWSVREVHE